MIKKITEDKRILSFYVVVLLALGIGFTFALSNASLAFNIGTAIIKVDEEAYGDTWFSSYDIEFVPILDSELESSTDSVVKIDFKVGGANTNNGNNIIYDIALVDLQMDCSLLSPYIKWKLVKDGTELSSGNFSYLFDTIEDGRLVLTEIQQDLPNYNANQTGYHEYSFYMWFSDSCQDSDITNCAGKVDQSALVGKYFSGKIEVELYTESKKSLVRNPGTSLDTSTCIDAPVSPNRPNLDSGNLIPVYYDNDEEVWKKADSSNVHYSWYNYDEKRWANAVIIGDSTKKETYQDADVDTPITESDITAFYVWIPRYKYRVWNITRQGGAESTYAYSAYTKGIDIKWEAGTDSTGNVECTYDVTTPESETNLSDTCVYNGVTTIKTTSGNSNFKNAWYTHPAFTFAGDELEGFWIGKFETSTTTDSTCYTSPSVANCDNTTQTPRILPDVSSLRYQTVSNQFMTSVKFQDYLSNNIDAHMLTNLEWGAVAYLTHSIYGLCDENGCGGVYQNNSSGYYTGRSGGNIAGHNDLKLANVYPDDSTSTDLYNSNGYYNYKGYKLDYSGNVITTKDITKVASTTRNITGVYDMSGGAYENVMGNKVDSGDDFYPSSAGTAWSGTNWYDSTNSALFSKYYNAYSYGTNYSNALAFNRARLGDATAEVLGSSTSTTASWKVGSGMTGSSSNFVYSDPSWFSRGGRYNNSGSAVFSFHRSNGNYSDNYSFRSSLS